MLYNEYMNKCSHKEGIMQKEDVIISRVLLEGYKHLDRLYEAMGQSIECLVASGYNSGYRGTTGLVYEKIINYTYRRAGIYNLKAIVNQTLEQLTSRSREVLTLHFIEQKEFAEIKDILGVSLRTAFRYYDKALQTFAITLNNTGFTEARIESEYAEEPFYIRMKKKVLDTQKVNVERGVRCYGEAANSVEENCVEVSAKTIKLIVKGDNNQRQNVNSNIQRQRAI
ncbi:MAG: hypothetical protein EOM87_05040 [Clostridia bacterium]|nr:hypothetical protein [Clostridia bacterium]